MWYKRGTNTSSKQRNSNAQPLEAKWKAVQRCLQQLASTPDWSAAPAM